VTADSGKPSRFIPGISNLLLTVRRLKIGNCLACQEWFACRMLPTYGLYQWWANCGSPTYFAWFF